MSEIALLPVEAHCINLADRASKWERAQLLWGKILDLVHVTAVDTRPNGIEGCYRSHLKVLEQADRWQSPLLIIEDDAIPCEDFVNRLALFLKQLPTDWDIFMLGHWPMPGHVLKPVTENIRQAKGRVLATHCYLVNPAFRWKMIEVFKNSSQKNLDWIWNILQDRYKVYAAIPSLSYQADGYSDTGNSATNYAGTRMYFKDKL